MAFFTNVLPHLNSPDRFIVATIAIILVFVAFERGRS